MGSGATSTVHFVFHRVNIGACKRCHGYLLNKDE